MQKVSLCCKTFINFEKDERGNIKVKAGDIRIEFDRTILQCKIYISRGKC